MGVSLDVYVRGTNGQVYDKPYVDGVWHNWAKIGGQVAPGTGPGTSGGGDREDLFVAGTDSALWHKAWTGKWSGWENLGGKLTSSPAAESPGTGQIDVFVRGTNGALYTRSYT